MGNMIPQPPWGRNEEEQEDEGEARSTDAVTKGKKRESVEVPKELLKPPKEEGLVVRTLLKENWECILVRLSTRDLFALLRTSKAMKVSF